MTNDEILQISSWASRGACAAAEAVGRAGMGVIPSEADLKVAPPADATPEQQVAWSFGTGHSLGTMKSRFGQPCPAFTDAEMEQGSDADQAFRKGQVEGWTQMGGVAEAINEGEDCDDGDEGEDEVADDVVLAEDNPASETTGSVTYESLMKGAGTVH